MNPPAGREFLEAVASFPRSDTYSKIVKLISASLVVLLGLAANHCRRKSKGRPHPSKGKRLRRRRLFLFKENSVVYVGDRSITVVGATWTPETAKLLAMEIGKITPKPITEVIDTNYTRIALAGTPTSKASGGADRIDEDDARSAGTALGRDDPLRAESNSELSSLPVVLPDQTFAGDFELQGRPGKRPSILVRLTRRTAFLFIFPRKKRSYGNCILKE